MADTQSRLVLTTDECRAVIFWRRGRWAVHPWTDIPLAAITADELAREILLDPQLSEVFSYLADGWTRPPRDVLLNPYAVREFFHLAYVMYMERGQNYCASLHRFSPKHMKTPRHEEDATVSAEQSMATKDGQWDQNTEREITTTRETSHREGPWEKIQVDIVGEIQAAVAHQKYLIAVTD